MRTATLIVALALFSGITEAATTHRARYLMGTVCEVAAENPEQIELAFAEAKRIESMLSTWIESSELSRVNRGEIEPSDELNALLSKAMIWSARTNRAFDPRLGDLIAAWGIREGGRASRPSPEPPTSGAPDDRRPQYEEGAFGKGHALDRMLALIDGEAVIDFGGQIIVRGSREVSVADPSNRERPVITFEIENASISTSSGSEKTFVIDGRTYSHILDPRKGEPLPPRGSVSVIADDGLTADILSTALYVMGEGDGLRWAAAADVAAIFIDSNRTIRLSPAARERARRLSVIDGNFSLKD